MLNYREQASWPNAFGQQQSPIRLSSTLGANEGPSLPIMVKRSPLLTTVTNDQTTIKVIGNGTTQFFNRPSVFQQVHFHVPAEHVVDGHQAAMEIHLVHETGIGQKTVVALFAELGANNQPLQRLIDAFDAAAAVPVNLPLTDWLPQTPRGFHYLGSLTTPPLSEGVEWFVITNATVTLSQDQLDWWQAHFPANNRALQPLNERIVERYGVK